MATQSLAMGEAFGKSFQYGKRKISSMTNEEFNQYTFTDMMNEQTANVRAYIPKLHEQMELSYSLQIDIFQEMVKIIPAFFEALLKSLQPLASEFQQFNTTPFNQNIPSPNQGGTLVSATTADEPTLISHENFIEDIPIIERETSSDKYNQAIFRAMSLEELIKGINSGRFTGSALSLAKHTLATRQEPTDQSLIPTVATSQQVEHQAWQSELHRYQATFVKLHKQLLLEKNKGNDSTASKTRTALRNVASQIRRMSNDYRSPNNSIRRDALSLRQLIANGLIKY